MVKIVVFLIQCVSVTFPCGPNGEDLCTEVKKDTTMIFVNEGFQMDKIDRSKYCIITLDTIK